MADSRANRVYRGPLRDSGTSDIHDVHHNDACYALALTYGDHRGALRHAIAGLRRQPWSALWALRVDGCFKRRNR